MDIHGSYTKNHCQNTGKSETSAELMQGQSNETMRTTYTANTKQNHKGPPNINRCIRKNLRPNLISTKVRTREICGSANRTVESGAGIELRIPLADISPRTYKRNWKDLDERDAEGN